MFQLLVSWWFPLEHIPKMWLSRDSKWTFFTGISFYNSGATLPSLSLLLLVGTPQGRLKQPLFFFNPVESTFVVDKSRWILNLRRFLGIVIVDEHFFVKRKTFTLPKLFGSFSACDIMILPPNCCNRCVLIYWLHEYTYIYIYIFTYIHNILVGGLGLTFFRPTSRPFYFWFIPVNDSYCPPWFHAEMMTSSLFIFRDVC